MNKENYTSLELSKKLAEAKCKLDADYYWFEIGGAVKFLHKTNFDFNNSPCWKVLGVPAYDILNDICIKYVKEFFKDEHVAQNIFKLLRKGKKLKAEEKIWKECKFNN